MPANRDIPYEPSIESFELYHKYHSPYRDTTYEHPPESEDWKTAVLKGPALPALGQAAAGAAGAAVSIISTYPFSLIVTRLQLQRQLRREREKQKGKGKAKAVADEKDTEEDDEEEYKGIIDAFIKIYKTEGGLRGLYTGVGQATGKAVLDSFIFFLAYTFLRQRRLRARGLKTHALLPVLDELGVGYLAESFTKLLTTPISTVLTRKQVEGLDPAKPQTSSTRKILSDIISSEKGARALWSGYSASLFLSLNPSLTFLLAEVLKYTLLPRHQRKSPPPAATFLLAAVSKAVASSLSYPFSMAKTRAQAASASSSSAGGAGKEKQPPTVLHAIVAIARTEGAGALYAGLGGDVLKGFFSHGITMLAKDVVYAAVVKVYYLALVLLRRWPGPEELLASARERAGELADAARERGGDMVEAAKDKGGDLVDAARDKGGDLMNGAKGKGGDLVDAAKGKAGVVKGVVAEKGRGAAESAGKGAGKAKRRVVEDVYSNETAEMVGDYVEDEAEEWRSLYRWFWEKAKRE
ncbi:hypothetical protein AJ79_05780 [Helicocarpus griseus UAMH5409]|uniref:Mitochondrial thiamine pyrophosphate carrier 1 n=1 Tax=Helicocarpus griseus UAMH5409 TaxID=1447875 RepID=A0A2B7XJU4_9EURO|nr:hypothetical protein AJ79_05780 [Helicocarpus griseus UAMH5409]